MGSLMKKRGIKCDGYRLTKDGKLVKIVKYRDASHRAAASKSNRIKVMRGLRP